MKGIMAHINRERRIIDIARIKNEQVLNELRDIKQYTLLGAKSVYSIEEASMLEEWQQRAFSGDSTRSIDIRADLDAQNPPPVKIRQK